MAKIRDLKLEFKGKEGIFYTEKTAYLSFELDENWADMINPLLNGIEECITKSYQSEYKPTIKLSANDEHHRQLDGRIYVCEYGGKVVFRKWWEERKMYAIVHTESYVKDNYVDTAMLIKELCAQIRKDLMRIINQYERMHYNSDAI
jgi:hypothetical protein